MVKLLIFFFFYCFELLVIWFKKYFVICVVYFFYYVLDVVFKSFDDCLVFKVCFNVFMVDMFIFVKKVKFDVFNVLLLMDNLLFLE